jgi:hypothetical protein
MSGPWVGAAAPAENIIALGYDGKPGPGWAHPYHGP